MKPPEEQNNFQPSKNERIENCQMLESTENKSKIQVYSSKLKKSFEEQNKH